MGRLAGAGTGLGAGWFGGGFDGQVREHAISAGQRYGDPFVNLEGTGDEEAVRIRDAMTAGGTIAYTYDLGACWEHEITLEKTVPRDHSQVYPVCAYEL